MNTVPFDKLGPGQSGRLAYQVLGQDRPIFNPQNIRYLSPDSVEIPATSMGAGASALSAGLAGANLINTFWPQLQEAEPCGFKQIDVACDVPLLENA